MKYQQITSDQILNLASKGLFIRGEIHKHSNNLDKASICIVCSTCRSKDVFLDYVTLKYTYDQVLNGKSFDAYLECKKFHYLNARLYLKDILDSNFFKEKLSDIVMLEKLGDNANLTNKYIQLPLATPAVIAHLARFHGMIGQSQSPKVQNDGLEVVYMRLGALISQQLKRWSQMVG
ncbi:MAG: hypothetical protein WC460_06025 [Patescibacteria group bacterium]